MRAQQDVNVSVTPAPAPAAAPESRGGARNFILAAGAGVAIWLLVDWQRKVVVRKEGEKKYMGLVQEAAREAGIPASILGGIVTAESGWSNAPNSSSAACGVSCIAACAGCTGGCAVGLGQLKRGAAGDVGVTGDLCDPATNLQAAARYLARLYKKYGNWETTAKAYTAGPGAVDRGSAGIRASLYAMKVVSKAADYQEQGIAGLGVLSASRRPRLFAPRLAA